MLAVGAGGDCSDIFFLSPFISLFFLPLSGMDGWVTCGLSCIVELLFYVHGKHLRSCRDGQ